MYQSEKDIEWKKNNSLISSILISNIVVSTIDFAKKLTRRQLTAEISCSSAVDCQNCIFLV